MALDLATGVTGPPARPPAPCLRSALLAPRPQAQAPAPWLPGAAVIPWGEQPALLMAFAHERELPQAALWAACGVPPQAAGRPPAALSLLQLAALLDAVRRGADAPDTAFVLGQQWLPGHYGLASHALQLAGDTGQALRLLCEHAGPLCPLLTPRLVACGSDVLLYWTPAIGQAGPLRAFLVDLHMSAVRALCEWLGGEPLPWRYHFNRTAPRQREQHEVYLGAALEFGCHIDAMRLPASCLQRPWPRHRSLAAAATLSALQQQPAGGRQGLLAALYAQLLTSLQQAPDALGLAHSAQHFGVSSATLKRQLAQAGTSFQAELDQVRSHAALYLIHQHGWRNEALAQELGFHDRTNFRRAFKRWTGLTPEGLRTRWQGG